LYNAALLALAAGVLFYRFLLRDAGLPFLCLFSATSHLYCPGCGCTRALEALFRLDPIASLAANPMVLWLLGTLAYYEIVLFLSAFGRRPVRVSSLPAVIFAYALLGYAVLRNLLLILCGIDPLGDLIQYWS
jgi:hypothetical protein